MVRCSAVPLLRPAPADRGRLGAIEEQCDGQRQARLQDHAQGDGRVSTSSTSPTGASRRSITTTPRACPASRRTVCPTSISIPSSRDHCGWRSTWRSDATNQSGLSAATRERRALLITETEHVHGSALICPPACSAPMEDVHHRAGQEQPIHPAARNLVPALAQQVESTDGKHRQLVKR